MSFILDALKKSENDRQRQSGPALYEVKVATTRSPLPFWAVGLIVLLGINLAIVAWVLLRRPSQPGDQTAATAPQPTAPASAPAMRPPGAAYPNAPPNGYPPSAAAAAPPAGPAVDSQGTHGTPTGYAEQTPQAEGARGLPDSTSAQTGTRASGDGGPNPDDYAPATEPVPSQMPGSRVRRGTETGVPLYSQIANGPGSGLPDLRLDMHAWDDKPENRFVLINMKTLHEGDALPDGVKVEAITREGAILSHHGTKFLLPRP